MLWCRKSLAATLLLSPHLALGWFRLPCTGPLVTDRIDPITAPGQIPSPHLHTVHGGSNFNASSDFNGLRASSCTSCQVAQDLSNYWFPTLYFRDPKTQQYEVVPNGGLLVYYQNRGKGDVANGGIGLKAFPPGFRMISGDPKRRSKQYQEGLGTQAELAERAITYTCLRYTTPSEDVYCKFFHLSSGDIDTSPCIIRSAYGFPGTDCEAGFQGRIHMPSCWDGENLDSTDHKSHVAFLSDLDNGECPSTHPVYLMKLFYEVTWDIHTFSSRWKESDGWPFMYSTG
ncbi:hypothetical protein ONZ45_g7887 [Pleurotus djamor]|nr:hypothetical protein ONZ45_g7887 [Pleurotus djamor]